MNKLFSTLAVVALSALSLNAQIKEGTIIYNMKVDGMPPEQAAMYGDMETKSIFKNGKSFSEIATMFYSSRTIVDDKNVVLMVDIGDKKIIVKQTKEQMAKEEAKVKDKSPDPKIEYTTEVKTIAGYECKKAIVTSIGKDKKEEKMDIWYCDKFDNNNKEGKGQGQSFMKGLKGMPFEFSGQMGPSKVQITAKSVSVEPVPDSTFEPSTEGYTVMTMDELKDFQRSMMGGGK